MRMYTSFDEMPVMLSVTEAADALGISKTTLYALVKKDKTFPAVMMGKRITIPKQKLMEWIDKKSER